MSGKLWLVTEGEYSDYRVVAAFEHEMDAHEAVRRGVGDRVETIYLYGTDQAPVRVLVHTARAVVLDDGTRSYEPACFAPGEQWLPEGALQRPEVMVDREDGRIFITADALNADQALKACRDREAKIRAEILTEP